ncbi:McrBC 5-methylcytosine restriction system component [Myceligenerans halotolerans]
MRVELAENDAEGRVVALSDEDASMLANARLVNVRRDSQGAWRLVPRRNRVGAVRVADLDLVVRPKAPFASVIFMLGYARDPGFKARELDGLDDDDLWAAVGETLARLAERALLRGVLQRYAAREESLAVLRGRMRVADQVATRPGVLLPLEVTYDEFTVDIPENQILRAGLRRMMFVPRLPDDTKRRLGHLAGRLDGVSALRPGAQLPIWASSRVNLRYQPVVRLAELVLRSIGLSTNAGQAPVASFVVDMATVFEDFIGVALREALVVASPRGRTIEQYQAWMDEEARVRIRPDLVHLVGGRVRLVVDAKYKLGSGRGRYPTPDVYQMHAYCTALGLRKGYLLYVGSRSEEAVPAEHRILNTDIAVVRWPLDVRVPPSQLLARIEQLAKTAIRIDE